MYRLDSLVVIAGRIQGSQVQLPIKEPVIPKMLWYQLFPCLALNIKKGNTGSLSNSNNIILRIAAIIFTELSWP